MGHDSAARSERAAEDARLVAIERRLDKLTDQLDEELNRRAWERRCIIDALKAK